MKQGFVQTLLWTAVESLYGRHHEVVTIYGIQDIDESDVIVLDQDEEELAELRQHPIFYDRQNVPKYLSGTQKRTMRDVKFVKDWLQMKGYPSNIEEMSDQELNFHLERFYQDVRTKENTPLSRKSLACIRSSLYRHLVSHTPDKRHFYILKNPAFTSSNQVLDRLLEDEKNREKTTKKNPLSQEDLRKLVTSGVLSIQNPQSLQWKVWVDIVLHFGIKGTNAVRHLTTRSFIKQADEQGREYFKLNFEMEKESLEKISEMKDWYWSSRMYKEEGSPNCPVQSLSLYLSKLCTLHDDFFQRPLCTTNIPLDHESFRYQGPISHRIISRTMGDISNKAGLSRSYTNICLRATQEKFLAEHQIHLTLQYGSRMMYSHMSSDELVHISNCMHKSFYSP